MPLTLRSTVNDDQTLRLDLVDAPMATPGPDEVVIRVDAVPINPSDVGPLLGGADPRTVSVTGDGADRVATFDIPDAAWPVVAPRAGKALTFGNEGCGVVVDAGSSAEAQALVGKTVTVLAREMYQQFRVAHHAACLVLPDGTDPRDGASAFVNPLTVLGFLNTMRAEGHSAIVHTAAASNLGQMLLKLCAAEGVPLVNIVRRPEQAELLRGLGAEHVVNSNDDDFGDQLTAALVTTGATLGFDATGGGTLASSILTAMERAQLELGAPIGVYGTMTPKQVYSYGSLDRSPMMLDRTYGMAWSVGGWVLPNHLATIEPSVAQAMQAKVAAEITTTFASSYAHDVDLPEMLSADSIAGWARMATGNKYLVRPNR